jgi:hypothetical protein
MNDSITSLEEGMFSLDEAGHSFPFLGLNRSCLVWEAVEIRVAIKI